MVLVLVSGLSWADHHGYFSAPVGDLSRFDGGQFRVAHVVDGDTLDLDAPDGVRPRTRVCLWGVNTPEIAHAGNDQPAQPYGEEARQHTIRLAAGSSVRLTLEPHRLRDRYGRLLALVELSDGTWLNERLLAEGLARVDARWTHRRLDRFEQLAQQARHERRGLWGAAPVTLDPSGGDVGEAE